MMKNYIDIVFTYNKYAEYTLRSIKKYAHFVNNIFILCKNQKDASLIEKQIMYS